MLMLMFDRYIMFKLCDMQRLPVTVTLLLFGTAYDKHWTLQEGSVIAVLNASFMPPAEKVYLIERCYDNNQ